MKLPLYMWSGMDIFWNHTIRFQSVLHFSTIFLVSNNTATGRQITNKWGYTIFTDIVIVC